MKSHNASRVLVGVVVFTLAACGKSADPATTGPGGEDASASSGSGGEPAMAATVEGTAPANKAGPAESAAAKTRDEAPLSMAGRMDAERKARTGEKPDVDDVLAAFKTADLEVKDVRQGVARTSKARYCVFGTSPGGHRVFVCEFNDRAEAEHGTEFMTAQLVDSRRRVASHGRLALTVFVTSQTPESDRESQRYFDVFNGLQLPTSPDRSADQ